MGLSSVAGIRSENLFCNPYMISPEVWVSLMFRFRLELDEIWINMLRKTKHQEKMIIETDRLILRPFLESDFEDAKSVWGDAETMSFYPQPYSDKRIREGIRKQIETFEQDGYGLFAVLEKSSGSYIGDCGITIQNIDGVREFEIGYHVKKECWGFGYATEAAQSVKKYGFETLKLSRLCCYMESSHQKSRKVAERIGMKVEKEYLNPANRNLPTTVYSVTCASRSA